MLVIVMKRCFLPLLLGVALPAFAQQASTSTSAPPPQELVVTSDGRLVEPWARGKTCSTDAAGQEICRWVVINKTTREIARVGDQLASKFALTGNGNEVRRLESSMDKALRLAGSPPASTD
ncbi:MAG: hypothetical protein RIR33_1892 [Pseudomonadota bacterium]|jgi:hypothetical protein